MSQVCNHFLTGICKYGERCTKAHVPPNPELLKEIDIKGTYICTFYPNCIFTSDKCRKLHVLKNTTLIDDFKNNYNKVINFETNSREKQDQINKIKDMVRYDLMFIKHTYDMLNSN